RWVVIGVETRPVMSPNIIRVDGRSPRQERPTLWTEPVIEVVFHVSDVHSIPESGIRRKSRTDVVVGEVIVHIRPGISGFRSRCRARLIVSQLALSGAFDHLEHARPVRVELESGIGAPNAVERTRPGKLPVGVDQSQTRLAENVAADSPNREGCSISRPRIIIRNNFPWTAVVRSQNSDRVRPHLSRQPRTKLRVANLPRKN